MINAVLHGKASIYEYSEDILTSTVFGTLRYLPQKFLISFLESAFLYDTPRTTFGEMLKNRGISLKEYKEVKYIFWSTNPTYGEPDLILLFCNSMSDMDDLLLLVEAKFKSSKSGMGENDQLKRYYLAIHKDLNNFLQYELSSFRGIIAPIIYLTESEASSEIKDSIDAIYHKDENFDGQIFHLRWQQLVKILEGYNENCTYQEAIIVNDLLLYLERLGLYDFSGISIPCNEVREIVNSGFPIFYCYKHEDIEAPYFSTLSHLNLITGEYCFYRG